MATRNNSENLDRVESMRREGRIDEALQAVEQILNATPEQPRARLLRSRLLHERGSPARAAEDLGELKPVLGWKELMPLVNALERLTRERQSVRAPAFATETMAKLLTQQGYFLEALEVYRRLFEAAPNRGDFWEEIIRLKTNVEQEGSREATQERIEGELERWRQWLEEHQRGS